jgi:large subunit ribosomal protein L24
MPQNDMLLIEGVHVAKRHQKATRRGSQGQIVEKPMPIHVSNVMLVENKKGVRTGYAAEEGKKVRVSKKTGKRI